MKDHTFLELTEEYLKWSQRQKTYSDKVYHIKHFIAVFGNMPLANFNTRLVDAWQSQRLTEVSAARVNRLMQTLKHMFTKAVDWRMAGENTLKAIRKVKPLKTPPGRLRYLSSEEYQTLIASCSQHLKSIVITAVHSGMRKGEILGLKWEQVDLKHGFILLDNTKNGERREIPINETLRETLEAIPHSLESEYVFTDRNGRPFRDVKRSFGTTLKRAGIHNFRFHDLRHCFASHLTMGGVELRCVQELLGHKTPTMTMRYSYLAPGHKLNAVRVLEKRLGSTDEKTASVFYNPSTISGGTVEYVSRNSL